MNTKIVGTWMLTAIDCGIIGFDPYLVLSTGLDIWNIGGVYGLCARIVLKLSEMLDDQHLKRADHRRSVVLGQNCI